jgi:hypothetical protein
MQTGARPLPDMTAGAYRAAGLRLRHATSIFSIGKFKFSVTKQFETGVKS